MIIPCIQFYNTGELSSLYLYSVTYATKFMVDYKNMSIQLPGALSSSVVNDSRGRIAVVASGIVLYSKNAVISSTTSAKSSPKTTTTESTATKESTSQTTIRTEITTSTLKTTTTLTLTSSNSSTVLFILIFFTN